MTMEHIGDFSIATAGREIGNSRHADRRMKVAIGAPLGGAVLTAAVCASRLACRANAIYQPKGGVVGGGSIGIPSRERRAVKQNSAHSNLYSWFLEEFDGSGQKLGPDYVPWDWSLRFDVRNCRVSKGIAIGKEKRNSGANVIIADLYPDVAGSRETRSYSFFGTNRHVKHFTLRIEKAADDTEKCHIYGSIAFEMEFDFETRQNDDSVELIAMVPGVKFDELAGFVSDGRSRGGVTLEKVNGFYAGWSPSIRTTHIKIHASLSDQRVQVEDGSTIAPPLVGIAGAFHIAFEKGDLTEDRQPIADIEEIPQIERPADPQGADPLKIAIAALEWKVARLAVPLWIAVGALVVSLFMRH